MNARRIWLLAGQAGREAAHLRVAWVLALATLALAAGVSLFGEFNFGMEEPRFLQDLTEANLMCFGTAQAILLTVTLVNGGLGGGWTALLFARGVRRPEWLVGCLLAVWVSLAGLVLAAHAVLGAVLAARGHPVSIAGQALAGAHALLRLGLVACFALVTSAVSRSSMLATTLALAGTVAAQLAPIIGWAGAHGRPLARLAWRILGGVLPDFAALDVGTDLPRGLIYAAGYAGLYAGLACLALSRREV